MIVRVQVTSQLGFQLYVGLQWNDGGKPISGIVRRGLIRTRYRSGGSDQDQIVRNERRVTEDTMMVSKPKWPRGTMLIGNRV